MMNEQAVDQARARQIAENIGEVRRTMADAAQKAGRSVEEVTLVAVSKTMPVGLVKMAYNVGVMDVGENRVQEALPKIADFHPEGLRWHMIGHVQSNKASKVVEAFALVQSVDSLHLAQALNRHAEEYGRRLPVLLEINVAGEASKEGMTLEETPAIARQIAALPALEVQGLMTVAPFVKDAEEVRPVFRELRRLRERLQQELPDCSWKHLSMGMTGDFAVAIEEGATIVRIGRAIFGERPHR
jgi:pyridoxal phosphate enzyme (YggS family)